jgi:hypothetical protein
VPPALWIGPVGNTAARDDITDVLGRAVRLGVGDHVVARIPETPDRVGGHPAQRLNRVSGARAEGAEPRLPDARGCRCAFSTGTSAAWPWWTGSDITPPALPTRLVDPPWTFESARAESGGRQGRSESRGVHRIRRVARSLRPSSGRAARGSGACLFQIHHTACLSRVRSYPSMGVSCRGNALARWRAETDAREGRRHAHFTHSSR